MSCRELSMIDVREFLRRRAAGQSDRKIARDTGASRKTVSAVSRRRHVVSIDEAALEGVTGGHGLTLSLPDLGSLLSGLGGSASASGSASGKASGSFNILGVSLDVSGSIGGGLEANVGSHT